MSPYDCVTRVNIPIGSRMNFRTRMPGNLWDGPGGKVTLSIKRIPEVGSLFLQTTYIFRHVQTSPSLRFPAAKFRRSCPEWEICSEIALASREIAISPLREC